MTYGRIIECPNCGSHDVEEIDKDFFFIIMRCKGCGHVWEEYE